MKPRAKKKQRGPGAPFMSQGGEDLIALRLFRKVGVRSESAVEFGAVDGIYKSNTAYFRHVMGWTVTLFDSDPRPLSLLKTPWAVDDLPTVHAANITAENINDIFRAYDVPDDLDLLSIDIDGNDLWVWKALEYRPSVVIIEYNPKWKPQRSRTVPYDPTRGAWDKTDYYGASAGALVRVGHEKGYILAASTQYNLIFVLDYGGIPELPLCAVKARMRNERIDPQERTWVSYP